MTVARKLYIKDEDHRDFGHAVTAQGAHTNDDMAREGQPKVTQTLVDNTSLTSSTKHQRVKHALPSR